MAAVTLVVRGTIGEHPVCYIGTVGSFTGCWACNGCGIFYSPGDEMACPNDLLQRCPWTP